MRTESYTNWQITDLDEWNRTIDAFLFSRRPARAVELIGPILRRLPRHLPTYFRLLQSIWLLRRWDEGNDWGQRLLRADPANELAWSILATGAEDEREPAIARQFWTRAFEQAPYNRPIRKGLSRTTLGSGRSVGLNRPALATLYRFGERWDRAAALYRTLLEEQAERVDFQCGLLEALWRGGQSEDALRLARHLARREPHLYLAWLVMDRIGDADDRALALAPMAMFDIDGEYGEIRFGFDRGRLSHQLSVPREDAQLLESAQTELD